MAISAIYKIWLVFYILLFRIIFESFNTVLTALLGLRKLNVFKVLMIDDECLTHEFFSYFFLFHRLINMKSFIFDCGTIGDLNSSKEYL